MANDYYLLYQLSNVNKNDQWPGVWSPNCGNQWPPQSSNTCGRDRHHCFARLASSIYHPLLLDPCLEQTQVWSHMTWPVCLPPRGMSINLVDAFHSFFLVALMVANLGMTVYFIATIGLVVSTGGENSTMKYSNISIQNCVSASRNIHLLLQAPLSLF